MPNVESNTTLLEKEFNSLSEKTQAQINELKLYAAQAVGFCPDQESIDLFNQDLQKRISEILQTEFFEQLDVLNKYNS